MSQHEPPSRLEPLAVHNGAVAADRAPVDLVVADTMKDQIMDDAAVAVARQPTADVRARAVASSARSRNALVGASRTLELAVTAELLQRGWNVTGTVRDRQHGELHDLVRRAEGRLAVEQLDMNEQSQVTALLRRLGGTSLDLLFVNAAITNGDQEVGKVPTDVFIDVIVTNALSPMRVVEALSLLVPPDGTIAVISSSQGSLTLNTNGGHEVYRASKSALNQLMRSYAARHHDDPRMLLLINPGWVKTDLGGPGVQLTTDDSASGVVDTLQRHAGEPGLQFLDYRDQFVPW